MTDNTAMPATPQDDARLLHEIRGHLTVAILAAQHLHRSHPDADSVTHLFTHLHTAHQRLLQDIEAVEAILQRT